MADEGKKVSELPQASNVSSTDRVLVLRDPSGNASVRTVTVNNFVRTLPTANSTQSGVIKVGSFLTVNTSGYLSVVPGGTEGVYPLTYVQNTNTYTVTANDVIIFVDPNSNDSDVQIILPTTGVEHGREFLIKNINPGANHKVKVITDAGISSNSNYLEDPVTGNFIVSYDIGVKGESHTWIFNTTTYKHLAALSSNPVFYASTNSYHQVTIVNPSSANNASGDWVAYNNQGNYAEGTGPFVDMGINSNTYTDTTYGNVWGPNDAYVYNSGGNLVIGPETNHSVKIVAGGTNTENIRVQVNSTAISVNTSTAVIAPLQTKANNASGVPGQICWDADYVYVCTATNTWKRANLNTF